MDEILIGEQEQEGVEQFNFTPADGDGSESIEVPEPDTTEEVTEEVTSEDAPVTADEGGYTDAMREENMSKLDQRIKEVGEFPGITGIAKGFDTGLDLASQGLGDFIADTSNTIGNITGINWFKGYNEWWDGHNPKSKDPVHGMVRDVSAVVIPSLMGGGLISGISKATQARHIPQAQRVLGSIMARMGIEVGIASITSQSYEQDNAAGALYKMFGLNPLGLATKDGMSPEKRRHLHMIEAGVFEVFIDVILGISAFANKLRLVNKNKKAINLMEQQADELGRILKEDGLDPVTVAVEGRRGVRLEAQKSEGIKRLANKGAEYDPFVNQPARPEQRAVDPDVFDIDPVGNKVDHWRILNNEGTTDGIARPVVSPNILDEVVRSPNTSERASILAQVFDKGVAANADAILENGLEISAKQLNDTVDTLVEGLFDNHLSFKEYQKILQKGVNEVLIGKKILGESTWIAASKAWTQVHREILDPNNLRASRLMQQQAADVVATSARSMDLLEGIGTNSRQWELISKKMKFLVGEVSASKEIVKRGVELRELIKGGDFKRVAEWLNFQADTFDSAIRASKSKAGNLIDELERIAQDHPLYMRPLAEAYDATNGDVDTLFKLHKWAEANIGLLKKGLFDRHPEMPSFFVQGLHAIRYNSILNGLAPVRALIGNSTMAVIKPISVFAGAAAMGDVATFKRAMYVYGGFSENIKRGFAMLGSDWRLANSNPEVALKRGRKDFKMQNMARFEAQASVAEAWRRDGKDGKVAMWNIASSLTHWNNWKINRWGINGLFSIDGFFKSLNASGNARAQAYDALFEATNGSFHNKQFQDLQRNLYDTAFDKTGKLLDSAAEFAQNELALNIDYKFIEKLEHFMGHVPAAKPLFMFPRTGVNALELAWSFNPASNLGPAITRARRTLAAQTADEISEILAEHGLPNTKPAFKQLQSEYIGRQLMGSGVVLGAGMWALEGNITGNGPQDKAQLKRLRSMGWQPLSIKNPITGTWHSYKGFEPFESILGLTADMVYQAERVDQSIAEDWFTKLVAAITMNTTNNTFTSGFEPLVAMFSGREDAWNRFLATTINSTLPQAGVRTILNNAITPQLKDVKNDFSEQLMNLNKFMFPSDSDKLVDMVDIYTGEPIRFDQSINAAANALMPMFKQNGTMEPWRQWLLSTGWSGLSEKRIDTISGGQLNAHGRQWINNWIGKSGLLKGQIIELMEQSPDKWESELTAYKKGLGLTGKQEDTPIKQTLLHRRLDGIHNEAFRLGLAAYHEWLDNNSESKLLEGIYRDEIKGNLQTGNTEEAFNLRDKLLQIKK